MSDEFIDRLRAADPAASSQPDIEALRTRVFAHVDDNVVSFTPRTARLRLLRYAAVLALIAMAAGGGYWGGSVAQQQPTTLAVDSNLSQGKLVSPSIGAGASEGQAAVGADAAGKMSSYGGWYGNTILKPAASVPNQAGEALAYQFTDAGIDRLALGRAIATAIGLDAGSVREGTYGIEYAIIGNSSLQVGNDIQVNFWGNNWERNPYACDQPMESKPQPAGGAAPAPTAMPNCGQLGQAPTKDKAIAQAKQALNALRLPMLDNATYTASVSDDRMVNVQVTPVIGGMSLSGIGFWVQVGEAGVFGMSGVAARLEKATAYPIDGARDVALRSQLRKWAAFGPMNVTPQTDSVIRSVDGNTTPTTMKRNGRLMVQGQLVEIDVDKATPALQQQWFPGGEVLFLPAWNYSASDGSVWQMLAITADYIDWTAAPNGPIAYAMSR